jgi:gamma-glutamyl:cysteine ligase YbdK (ATP-grasp superfamily)
VTRLRLFEATGVEIEYMIVDRQGLGLVPACDRLIESVAGEPVSEVERGSIAWSNELVLHVLELKTNGPATSLASLASDFHAEVRTANEHLARMESPSREGAILLPGGVHAWMEPLRETVLWPHEYNEVYRTFDRIFGCSGHGWSNLQSTHVNLPFGDDDEFARLHAAIRVVLPLIPALAASSPFLEGVEQPVLDARLEAYRLNATLVPEVAGLVVPEPVGSEEEYREVILEPLYRALAPHDPEGVLRHEWANARGAIARFERGAIEIRVIDTQECPRADLSVVALLVAVVRALTEERWASRRELDSISTQRLAELLRDSARAGDDAVVLDRALLGALGVRRSEARAGEVWQLLADRLAPDHVPEVYGATLERIVAHGPLAARMRRAHRSGASIRDVTGRLVLCLADDTLFLDGAGSGL